MTQVELAAASGVSQVGISQIEIGEKSRNPRMETIERLAVALGVDTGTLIAAIRASQATPPAVEA